MIPFLLLFFCFLFHGCAGNKAMDCSPFTPPTDAVLIRDVPFFPQTDSNCGPASLASVLTYYGDAVTPKEVAESIYRQNLGGTVTLDMILFARQRGFTARWYSGEAGHLRKALEKGVPLIVMVDLGFARVIKNHYMVLVGCDPQGVIVNTVEAKKRQIPWQRFLSAWQRTACWTLWVEKPHVHGSTFEERTKM
jgi:predicted double-glycine peptidase